MIAHGNRAPSKALQKEGSVPKAGGSVQEGKFPGKSKPTLSGQNRSHVPRRRPQFHRAQGAKGGGQTSLGSPYLQHGYSLKRELRWAGWHPCCILPAHQWCLRWTHRCSDFADLSVVAASYDPNTLGRQSSAKTATLGTLCWRAKRSWPRHRMQS